MVVTVFDHLKFFMVQRKHNKSMQTKYLTIVLNGLANEFILISLLLLLVDCGSIKCWAKVTSLHTTNDYIIINVYIHLDFIIFNLRIHFFLCCLKDSLSYISHIELKICRTKLVFFSLAVAIVVLVKMRAFILQHIHISWGLSKSGQLSMHRSQKHWDSLYIALALYFLCFECQSIL